MGAATEELQCLMNFSASITQYMGKAMKQLLDLAFVSMVNMTLVRRDSYIPHVKSSLKQDTLAALHQAPLDFPTLFPDSVLKKSEEDISKFEDKDRSHTHYCGRRDSRFHPNKRSGNRNRGLVN